MHGVSEVIAIILILMITISIAGLAYTFMSSTMSETTAAASTAVTTTTTSMLTSFTIESMDVAKVYIRNTGQTTLTNLSVYVNDVPAIFNATPSAITAGQVGTITIYSFIAEGDTIKITSPNGFSTSKAAPDPCTKAVGCWKFDEGSGTTAYDSSPYGNTGTLVNGTAWTGGKYGGGLLFDGVNDYVSIPYSNSLNQTYNYAISLWLYWKGNSSNFYARLMSGTYGNHLISVDYTNHYIATTLRHIDYPTTGDVSATYYCDGSISNCLNRWIFVTSVVNDTHVSLYINGNLVQSTTHGGNLRPLISSIYIGGDAYSTFNGTMDEVRVYNRAIY